MEMASDHRIIDITDSSMEDETEISQPPDIAQESLMWFQERNKYQILEPLPKARDHLIRVLARVTEKPYIYRVPHRLREVNKRAYEPNVISTGPYHHANDRLKRTEAIKLSCFLHILWEDNSVVDRIVRSMQRLEAQVRECYEEPSDLDSEEFVEMMVYDGCFIVQLIRFEFVGDIFKERGILSEILNDLLLLENQLPFFVLSELYHIIAPEEDVQQLAHHALELFRICSLFHLFDDPVSDKEIKHLLHLVHSCHHPSASGIKQHRDFKENATNSDGSRNSPVGVQNNCFFQMAARIWDCVCMHQPLTASEATSQRKMEYIGNASELDDAGINFLGTEFDLVFTKDSKVLGIPTLRVSDSTERRFRNYIAYEQFIPSDKPTYFSDYVLFMDTLIHTSKDVQLLRTSGIIENWLGDDEAVAQMFKRLMDSVYWSSSNFYYAEIVERVNEHCQKRWIRWKKRWKKRWNRWKPALKKNYFNSPWSLISFLAATVLLLLTAIQTVFSLLSYYD